MGLGVGWQVGSAEQIGDRAWGDRRWGMGWVGELGQQNRLVMRELAGKLRDVGDGGELERKKN